MKRKMLVLSCALMATFCTLSARAETITLAWGLSTSVTVGINVTQFPMGTETYEAVYFAGPAGTQTFSCGCPPPPPYIGIRSGLVTSMTFTLGTGQSVTFDLGELPGMGERKRKTLSPIDPSRSSILIQRDLSGNYTFQEDWMVTAY
jgi:hypothetical protein